MTTFVLVPGGWHGGWSYENVVPLLEAVGHTAHALTLTGLAPDDDDVATARANLDTHTDDVLRVFDREGIRDATLVGHSYAGMVVAAVAARATDRISRVVHVDAYVPDDGDSCWSLTSDGFRRIFAEGAAELGYAVHPPYRPPTGGDPRRRPHPLASFLQQVRLPDGYPPIPRREFVFCSGWEDTPFEAQRERLVADPHWQVHDLPTGHSPMREDPTAITAVLLDDEVPARP